MCNLFQQLKNKLSEHFPIPSTGIIAGQAVAEAYFDTQCINIKSRYKDLDVFLQATDDNNRMFQQRGNGTELAVSYASGAGEFSKVVNKFSYNICDSSYDLNTNINAIYVKLNEDIEPTKAIVDGFDINSAAIGINLSTETVYIHPEFLSFTESKELKLITIHTPISSFIRLVQKHMLIDGSVLNLDRVLQQVSMAISMRTHGIDDSVLIQGTGITVDRYNSLSDSVKLTLDKHFKVVFSEHDIYGENEMNKVNAVRFSPLKAISLIPSLPFGADIYSINEYKSDLNVINNIIDNKLDKNLNDLIRILAHYNDDSLNRNYLPWLSSLLVNNHKISNEKINTYRQFSIIKDYFTCEWLWENNDNYFDINQLESYIVFASELLIKRREHNWMSPMALLREANPYIRAGVTSRSLIKQLISLLEMSLPTPQKTSYKPNISLVITPRKKMVTTWFELVHLFPKASLHTLNATWDSLCENKAYIVYKTYCFDTPIMNSHYNKENLFQLDNNVVIRIHTIPFLTASVKRIIGNLKSDLSEQIKNRSYIKSKSNKRVNSQPPMVFDSNIPF